MTSIRSNYHLNRGNLHRIVRLQSASKEIQKLCDAVFQSNYRVLKENEFFLRKIRNKKGYNLLHLAVEIGDLDMVKYLICDAKLNYHSRVLRRFTPLAFAVRRGNFDVVRWLGLVCKKDRAPADYYLNVGQISVKVRGGDDKISKWLKENGYRLDFFDLDKLDGMSSSEDRDYDYVFNSDPLHGDIRELGFVDDTLFKRLVNAPSSVFQSHHIPAKSDFSEYFDVKVPQMNGLGTSSSDISKKKKINPVCNSKRLLSLGFAVEKNRLDVVKYLIDKVKPIPWKEQWGAITHAATLGRFEIFKYILSFWKLESDQYQLCMRLACWEGCVDIVKWLYKECHADPNIKSGKDGTTPLWWALNFNRQTIIEWFISQEEVNPNEQTHEGVSVIEKIASLGHRSLFKSLALLPEVSSILLQDLVNKYQAKLGLNSGIKSVFIEELKNQKRKKVFERALNNAKVSQRYAVDYKLLVKELNEALELLTDPDILWDEKKKVELALNTLHSRGLGKLSEQIKRVLGHCKEPCHMLPEGVGDSRKLNQKSRRKSFRKQSPLKGIKKCIEEIRHCTRKIPKEDDFSPLKAELNKLIGYYKSFCKRFSAATSEEERQTLSLPPPRILRLNHEGEQIQGIAKPEVIEKLLGKRENEHGGHHVFQWKGVHYKLFPNAPGIESAVEALGNFIAGALSPPTQLLKIIDQQGRHYALQASKTVSGINLLNVLTQRKELLKKLDLNNFSQMFVLSLLTSQQDGKPDNYMVEFKMDQAGEVISWRIMGIDNDLAFAPPFVKSENDQGEMIHVLWIRNVLYFFPQMKLAFDQAFREKFIELSPEQVMFDWLGALQAKDREYQQLVEQGVFHRQEYAGDLDICTGIKGNTNKLMILGCSLSSKGMQLPLRLFHESAKVVYLRICQIQSLLKKMDMTHDGIFRILEPRAHKIYADVFKSEKGDINKSLKAVYEFSRKELESKGKSPVTEQEFNTMFEQGNLSSLTKVAYSTAMHHKFDLKRTNSVQDLASEWIASLDWGNYSSDEALFYLEQIEKLDSIEWLELNNCTVLNDGNIIPFLKHFKKVQRFAFKGETRVTLAGLRYLLKYFDQLCVKIDPATFKLTAQQVAALVREYRMRISVRVDTGNSKLLPAALYALAKELGIRLEVVSRGKDGKERVFRLGRRLRMPEAMMDRLIRAHCNDRLLFDTLLYAIKEYPSAKVHINIQLRTNGFTFLHQAAASNNREVYEWLLKAGVNPNIKDKRGKTAAEYLKTPSSKGDSVKTPQSGSSNQIGPLVNELPPVPPSKIPLNMSYHSEAPRSQEKLELP